MNIKRYSISRFWFYYFIIRIFYLFFAVFVFDQLTGLGDTRRYITSTRIISMDMFTSSTYLMDAIGGNIGKLFGRNMLLSNFPFMVLSFFAIKIVIEKLSLRKYINNTLILILLSFPNFCIWTSVCSKETFGLIFSAIISITIINFINGNCKIKIIDIIGLYLCLMFKAQYLPFIFQGLIFIFISNKFLKHKPGLQLILGCIILFIDILFVYLIRDLINYIANTFYIHFEEGRSTRENYFMKENDFFRYLPWGMYIAFFGPTIDEMISKPLQAIAGIESFFLILILLYLAKNIWINLFLKFSILTKYTISYFLIFIGICFIHYPFGIFNPGSAIRYRTNFIFIFIILLLYLYSNKNKQYPIKNEFKLQK